MGERIGAAQWVGQEKGERCLTGERCFGRVDIFVVVVRPPHSPGYRSQGVIAFVYRFYFSCFFLLFLVSPRLLFLDLLVWPRRSLKVPRQSVRHCFRPSRARGGEGLCWSRGGVRLLCAAPHSQAGCSREVPQTGEQASHPVIPWVQ